MEELLEKDRQLIIELEQRGENFLEVLKEYGKVSELGYQQVGGINDFDESYQDLQSTKILGKYEGAIKRMEFTGIDMCSMASGIVSNFLIEKGFETKVFKYEVSPLSPESSSGKTIGHNVVRFKGESGVWYTVDFTYRQTNFEASSNINIIPTDDEEQYYKKNGEDSEANARISYDITKAFFGLGKNKGDNNYKFDDIAQSFRNDPKESVA